MSNEIIHGDCIPILNGMEAKSVPLIIADPPYNIGKAAWDKIDGYLDWCGEWVAACERVLADNGSFYMFHNDMLAVSRLVCWIADNTTFQLKNFIVWNKRFDGMNNKGFMDGYVVLNDLRGFHKMAEYILFYTFQDGTGLQQVHDDRDCFRGIKEYLRAERKKANDAGYGDKELRRACGVSLKGGGLMCHFWGDAQWMIPTADMYAKLQTTGYFQRPYGELRLEYEELRYTFNNQKTHHSVWNYETVRKPQHPTQKPVDLIENIILHSSNEGDLVVDPFSGSGTTPVACVRTGRRYVGIDTDAGYCQIAERRIAEERSQPELELAAGG